MKEIKKHIQFWEVSKEKPSREDVLLTLKIALNLLAEALPIAFESVGSRTVNEQMEFWLNFEPFETETDLTAYEYDPKKIRDKLNEWSETCDEIAHTTNREWAEEAEDLKKHAQSK